MPDAEYSSRDGGCCAEMHHGQRGGESGVLHADLYGDGLYLGDIHMQSLRDAEADRVAAEVVQDDDAHDEQTGLHDALRADRNDTTDDEHDSDDGHERQQLDEFIDRRGEERIDDDAEHDRQDDDLDDGHHHGCKRDIDPGAG